MSAATYLGRLLKFRRPCVVLALTLATAPAMVGGQGVVTLPDGADPNDWEVYFDAGVARLKTAPSDAAVAFVEASRRDPSRAEPYFARWVAFWLSQTVRDFSEYRRGDETTLRRPEVRAADSLYLLAVTRNPFVHRGLEVMLFDRGQRLLGNADTRGWTSYSEGDFLEAVAVYSRSIERDPTGTLWQRRERALSYVAYNDLRRAAADLRFILVELRRRDEVAGELAYYSSKHGLLHMLGLIHARLRENGVAREAFSEALLENAGFAPAHAGLGALARAERDMPGAAAAYEQAVLLAPHDVVVRFAHAQALFDAGRVDSSVAEVRRVIAAEPVWAPPYLLLARALERSGKQADARPEYERYLNRTTLTDPQVRTIRARLGLAPRPE